MHLIFYGEQGDAAKAKAAELRKGKDGRKARAVHCYACREAEAASSIDFMPDVPVQERARLTELFKMAPPLPGAELPPPPPPSPFAGLEVGWRKSTKTSELVKIAQAVTGRTPENREQAISIIAEKFQG